MRLRIDALASTLPERVETAEQLAPRIGRTAAWVADHAGVAERRICDEPVEVLAARACRAALGDGPPPDLLLYASVTPRQLIPDTSVFVHRELGLRGVPAFSIHASCLSFLVGLRAAAGFLDAYPRVLLVSAEVGSRNRNMAEPESAALIGDGAAAALLVPSDGPSEILAWTMSTWSEGAELAELRGCGLHRPPDGPETTPEDNLFSMNGPAIFKLSVRKLARVLRDTMGKAGVTIDDIAVVVPHQASGPALRAAGRLGLTPGKVHKVLHRTGNCIAASLPIALADAVATGRLKRGELALLVGTGAGVGIGAAVIRW